jgi:hypothetical protein
MPLIESTSDKARSANIAMEIRAGKDSKVAEAIGYSEQRRARRKGTLTDVKKRRRRESEVE